MRRCFGDGEAIVAVVTSLRECFVFFMVHIHRKMWNVSDLLTVGGRSFVINLMNSIKIRLVVMGGMWNFIDSVLNCDNWGGYNCPS